MSASKRARTRSAAIAYFTVDHLGLDEGDVLVVNAGRQAIASGQTVAPLLRRLFERGVKLYSYDRLHAKFAVFDRLVYTSSANLSRSSLDVLFEVGIATDDPGVRSQALATIEKLKGKAIAIDDSFLLDIEMIAVKKSFPVQPTSARIMAPKRKSRTWLLGVRSVGEPGDETERKKISKDMLNIRRKIGDKDVELGWCSFPKKYQVAQEAIAGDTAIFIWRDAYRGDPKKVYRHEAILANRSFDKVNRLYHTQLSEDDALSWTQFNWLAMAIGLPTPTQSMMRVISDSESDALNAQWEAAKSM